MFKKTAAADAQLRGVSWESDVIFLERQSEKRAWRLVYVLLGVVALFGIALLFLLPLKSTVPYVFTVDKLTGEVAVGATAKDYINSSELNDKHWVNRFVLSHERYNYRLLQSDYDTVQLLASDATLAPYAARYEGPNSLEKKYGEYIQTIPQILSISISGGKLATVRFETKQTDIRQPGEVKTTRWIALLRYEYRTQLGRKEPELIQNPLGFTVVGYQVDPELVSTSPGATK